MLNRALVTTLLLLATVLLQPPSADAQSRVTVVPALSVSSVYDDNLFARQQGDAGEMTQLRPSLDATLESPRLTLRGTGSFDIQRSNHASLNTLDARRNTCIDSAFRTTPDTTLMLTGRYDLTQTPGELNIESGTLSDRQRAERFQVTPSMTHRIGEKANASGSYDWISERLTGDDTISLHVVRGRYEKRVSTRDTLSYGGMTRVFLDNIGTEFSGSALVGWTRQFTETIQVTLQAGPRISSYGSGIGPEVTAGFMRASNRLKIGLDYWHGETIVLGIHGPVRVDTATAKFTWPITRRLEIGNQTGVSDILTLDQREATSYRSTLVGSWSPGGPFVIAGSYGVDYQKGDVRRNLFVDPEVLRHVFRVSLTIAPRLSHSIQPSDEGPARPRR